MDSMWEEITALEGQLASLKCNYRWWRDMVGWPTLPEQHQMTEGDLQVGLEILNLVQVEPWCLLTAMERDTSQRRTVKMAMMWQLVKALQDDYIKLKDNVHILWHQALAVRPHERKIHQPLPSSDHPSTTAVGHPTQAKAEGRLVPLRTPSSGEDTLVGDWGNPLTDYFAALPQTLLSTGSRQSWHCRSGTSPEWCTKRLRQKATQRSARSQELMTDMLGSWDAGSDLLSYGPLWKGPVSTSYRHRCISKM